MTTRTLQTITAAAMIMLLVFASYDLHAQGAQQANAGADTTICKDQCVTIGTPMDPNWCFHWQPHAGLSDPYTMMPEACPEQTTTYTLTVTGPDYSFISTDQVVVTVVEISPITFSVNPLPTIPFSTSQAWATTSSGGNLIWTIEGDDLGATISRGSGLVTVGSQSGMITVRATDSLNQDCYIEATLCLGSGEDCCQDYYNATKTFGPITISIPGGISPVGPADAEGYCMYQVITGVTVEMEGVFERTYGIQGVTVSWKEKTSNPADFKDVTITWNGSVHAGTFGLINANIAMLNLSVSGSGDLTGTVEFDVYLNEDQQIGPIAVLRAGLGGNFTYTYTSGGGGNNLMWGGGFGGVWDFGGIFGFQVDLVKGGSVIASMTAESFDSQGNINNVVLQADTPAVWVTSHFTCRLLELALAFNYSIPDNEIDFIGGTGQVKVSDVNRVEGDFLLTLNFSQHNVVASVTMVDVKAFSCVISGTLSVDFDYEFNLNLIAGSNISAEHNEFDQAFTNVAFEVSQGALQKFSIGHLVLKYKETVEFTMTEASYVKATGVLEFNSKLVLPGIEMEVDQFRINEVGFVTVGNLRAEIDQSPVLVSINVGWSQDHFQGSFVGSFAGGVSIGGSVVVGATATYNYGHFALGLTGNLIPLGPSGLLVSKLAGEFGFNWAASLTETGTGMPEQGALTIGFGLGLSDIASLVMIEGYVRLVLGSASHINLQGAVKVTANPPHFFQGQTTILYELGKEEINGNISAEVKFPPATGNVLYFNTGPVVFNISQSQWGLTGQNMNGKLFNEADITANVDIYANLSGGGGPGFVYGNMNGHLDWNYYNEFSYPAGFDPTNCSTAAATSNFLGFGLKGEFSLHMEAQFVAIMRSEGFQGSINMMAKAQAGITIRWPSYLNWSWSCVDIYNASVEGVLVMERHGSQGRVHGTVNVKYNGEARNATFDFNI